MVAGGGHVLDVAAPVVVREGLQVLASWQELRKTKGYVAGRTGR